MFHLFISFYPSQTTNIVIFLKFAISPVICQIFSKKIFSHTSLSHNELQKTLKIFQKKSPKRFANSKKGSNFAIANSKRLGPLAQLNRVFDYGSKGYRFESCMGHKGWIEIHPFFVLYGFYQSMISAKLRNHFVMTALFITFARIWQLCLPPHTFSFTTI